MSRQHVKLAPGMSVAQIGPFNCFRSRRTVVTVGKPFSCHAPALLPREVEGQAEVGGVCRDAAVSDGPTRIRSAHRASEWSGAERGNFRLRALRSRRRASKRANVMCACTQLECSLCSSYELRCITTASARRDTASRSRSLCCVQVCSGSLLGMVVEDAFRIRLVCHLRGAAHMGYTCCGAQAQV